MATIGSFKKVGNDFQGEIVTLSLQAKGVRIVAEAIPPTTRLRATASLWAGPRSAQPGRSAPRKAATTSRSSSTIPSFNAPIYANLFDDEGGEGYTLLWSRPRKNGE